MVAVDCNGADLGPAEVAAGAALAAAEGARVLLFGPAGELGEPPAGRRGRSTRRSRSPRPQTRCCAARTTPEASIVQAARAVAEGRAQALVCAGGTGAALAAGTFNIKRAPRDLPPGAGDPAAGAPSWPVTLLDVGANAEAGASTSCSSRSWAPRSRAPCSGSSARASGCSPTARRQRAEARWCVEAHAELSERASDGIEAFEFVGNVEGGDVVTGRADVIVTDGFTGNIALKLMEGVSQTMLGAIRERRDVLDARRSSAGRCCAARCGGFREEIDPEASGGAYLLGLRRLGVVPHGRFTRTGFAQAILRAERGAREDIVAQTHRALEQAGALTARARVRVGR